LIKTEPELAEKARRVISTQLAVSVATAVGFFIFEGGMAAVSALYGGLVCIAATFLLLRGVSRATHVAAESPGKSMTILYIGAAQRFLLVLALLGAGLALLKLHPLGVLLGFGLAQFSTLMAGRTKPGKSPGKS